ncbi:maltase 1-like isoform X2 [Frieseomelitta varia]|uniref:maltase 1-like isoform X2 n=1 Tax=Frieseomelitta varia TaxID=561572 RepID=UPI001CB698FD|nr:maltase 1-like isoform X2 [Frieseomelitta varia]
MENVRVLFRCIESKLEYLKDTGITAIWLSPINKSPMKDFGYDISDFRDVDPIFGSLNDLEDLLSEAHKLGIKIILDLVPNHTSNEHLWFKGSAASNTSKYADYYIWKDVIPNNWVSVFNNSAWTYHKERKQYYFHQFYPEQPDLNYRNPSVQEEMKEIIKFWLDKGIDGFRIDAIPFLFESANITLNEPKLPNTDSSLNESHFAYYDHIYIKDQPETYDMVQSWREYVDHYANKNNRDEIVILTEAYASLNNMIKYYDYGSHVPFNFKFITDVNAKSNTTEFANIANTWLKYMPDDGTPNWVMGNHDRVRVGTRYPGRADQLIMLEMILPGIAVTYYGEEIGMVDNSTLYMYDIRDGCRTPFQWDNTINAGFSNATETWLPVHSDYKINNLEKQKNISDSHYNLYKSLIQLRKKDVLTKGTFKLDTPTKNVLFVLRKDERTNETISLLLNFSPNETKVDLTKLLPEGEFKVLLANVNSTLRNTVVSSNVNIPSYGSLLLVQETSGANAVTYSILSLLLVVFIFLV